MTEAYEIVHAILEQHRGLPKKLHSMNGKSPDWYRSHGYQPKTENPLSNGNVSEVEHYMRYCRKYEAGAKGAGRMLSHSVFAALEAEFCEQGECDQTDLEVSVIDETCDVQKWLARFDIDSASKGDLGQFIDECKQAEDVIAYAKAQAIARLKPPVVRDEAKRAAAVVNTVAKLNGGPKR